MFACVCVSYNMSLIKPSHGDVQRKQTRKKKNKTTTNIEVDVNNLYTTTSYISTRNEHCYVATFHIYACIRIFIIAVNMRRERERNTALLLLLSAVLRSERQRLRPPCAALHIESLSFSLCMCLFNHAIKVKQVEI